MEDRRHLDILVKNHAGCLKIKGCDESINYGVIRIEDGILIYWTRLAMLHMKQNPLIALEEENLIKDGYVKTIPISEIEIVYF